MYRIIVALVVCRLVTFSAFAASEPSYSSSMARRGMASSGDKMLKPARSATTVDLSIARGGYAALRFALRSGDAGLTEIRIQFGDGSVRAEHGALAFGRNRQTVPISFASGNDAGDRFIDRVSVGYHAKGRSTIEVWGIQTPKGATMLRTEGPYAATPAELETAARKTQLQKAVDSVDLKAETTSARAWELLRRLQDGKLTKIALNIVRLNKAARTKSPAVPDWELQHLRDDIEAAQYNSP